MSPLEQLPPLLERLIQLAEQDDAVRQRLRDLAHAVLELTELDRSAGPSPTVETVPLSDSPPRATAPTETTKLATAEPLPPLKLGQAVSWAPISVPAQLRWTPPSEGEFPLTVERCRLKAQACRWARRRRQLEAQGASTAAAMQLQRHDLITRAKALPDCFLWMCHKKGPQLPDPDAYETAAACFENLAEASLLVKQVLDDRTLLRHQFESALHLLAEAQSALRSIVQQLSGQEDHDQLLVFRWLKQTAAETGLYIVRQMRVNDPSDPQHWPALAAKIEDLEGTVQQVLQRNKQHRKLLDKVRHKVSLIAKVPQTAEGEWRTLFETVEALIEGGLPPSNSDLREILLPIIDDLPGLEPPEGCPQVFREIDRFLAATPAPTPSPSGRAQPTEVLQVARPLAGSSVVLIGGQRWPPAHQAIVEAFGLGELYWVETRDHQSMAGFEPYVARSDVALAILAVRWSSHSFNDVKVFTDRYDKPLVCLPGGNNPRVIARHILQQCSERLPAQRW